MLGNIALVVWLVFKIAVATVVVPDAFCTRVAVAIAMAIMTIVVIVALVAIMWYRNLWQCLHPCNALSLVVLNFLEAFFFMSFFSWPRMLLVLSVLWHCSKKQMRGVCLSGRVQCIFFSCWVRSCIIVHNNPVLR